MKKAERVPLSELTDVDKLINKVLGTSKNDREFNFRYLYILMMIAKIKDDSDIEIYRSHGNGKDVFTVISSEINTYQEITIDGEKFGVKI